MSDIKWEYKIVDHSNSTAMGYSNPETEDFKETHNFLPKLHFPIII